MVLKKSVKKRVYIGLFIVLGIIVQQLIHAIIEIGYIALLTSNWEFWGFGWSFATWMIIHAIFAVTLFALGLYAGFSQGRYWWHYIYER